MISGVCVNHMLTYYCKLFIIVSAIYLDHFLQSISGKVIEILPSYQHQITTIQWNKSK